MKAMKLFAIALAAMLGCCARAELSGDRPVDMSSGEVYRLEMRLAELGYFSGEANETYDTETRSALESFQQANGLDVTGAADEATSQRLFDSAALSRKDYLTRFSNAYAQMDPLAEGSSSNDVLVMQRRLKDYGFYAPNPTGSFDSATRRAVERFQMVNGLQVTGVADGAMLMRLMADSPITWPAFLAEMSAGDGDAGLNVYALQKQLSRLGYFTGVCTASYGELTQQAVRLFQQDNGLQPTGQADANTWALIYSGTAKSPKRDDALQFGDFGDEIRALQERLNALGFFDQEIDGNFGYTTETAVRLFQMASSLEATGALDARTQEQLDSDKAASMLDSLVQARFTMMLDAADERTQHDVAEVAESLVGAFFGTQDDALYPGFSFVQYVCVAAGLPVTFPEDVIRMADRQVESISAVEPGDIVAFQGASADAVTILLAIGVGDDKVICTPESGGWAEYSYMDRMEGATIYCWDAE